MAHEIHRWWYFFSPEQILPKVRGQLTYIQLLPLHHCCTPNAFVASGPRDERDIHNYLDHPLNVIQDYLKKPYHAIVYAGVSQKAVHEVSKELEKLILLRKNRQRLTQDAVRIVRKKFVGSFFQAYLCAKNTDENIVALLEGRTYLLNRALA